MVYNICLTQGLAVQLIPKAYDNWNDVYDWEENLNSIQSVGIIESQGAALPSSSSPNGYLGLAMLNEMENAETEAASLSPAEHAEQHRYGRSRTFDDLSPLDEELIRSVTQQMIDNNNLCCSDGMIDFASTSSYNDRDLGNEEIARPRTRVVNWVTILAALRWAIFIRKKAAERRS